MIYAALTLWLLGILAMGFGIHRLWSAMLRAQWVNWALLPGTIVSEMAYIFGCLIMGGEIRRAKLLDLPGGKTAGPRGGKSSSSSDGEPATEAAPRWKVAGPLVASLLSLAACMAGILIAHSLLGGPVIREFITGEGHLSSAGLPRALPTSWTDFWSQAEWQVALLHRMAETCGQVDWFNWRVPLFVYLSLCLSIRLAPVGRPVRPTLAAAVAIAAVIAVAGLLSTRFDGLTSDVWPLVTYVWSSLLLLLVGSLVARGLVGLVRVLIGKS